MDEREPINRVADWYRLGGYEVVLDPGPDLLPAAPGGVRPDLLARKNGETLLVQVKRRDQIGEITPPTDQGLPPGWSWELAVLPSDTEEGLPVEAARPAPGHVEALVAEAERLAGLGASSAALLIAWSAVEAAMREVAAREGVDPMAVSPGLPDNPGLAIRTLVSEGLLSRDDHDRLRPLLAARNRLVHGLPAQAPGSHEVGALVALTRRLLGREVASTDR